MVLVGCSGPSGAGVSQTPNQIHSAGLTSNTCAIQPFRRSGGQCAVHPPGNAPKPAKMAGRFGLSARMARFISRDGSEMLGHLVQNESFLDEQP